MKLQTFTDVANVAAAIASIFVTFIIFELSKGIEEARVDREKKAVFLDKERLTLERLSAINIRVYDLQRLLSQDADYSIEDSMMVKVNENNEKVEVDWKSENSRRKNIVISILNEYEEICVGIDEDLYSQKLVEMMRKYSISTTFENYLPFILYWRSTENGTPDAWQACLDLVDNW